MNSKKLLLKRILLGFSSLIITVAVNAQAQTETLWLFDEETNLYPSQVLENNSDNDYPLVLGLGGRLVDGKYGNALDPSWKHPDVKFLEDPSHLPSSFGLIRLEKKEDRKTEQLTWHNANFSALMISGENHLRKEVGFVKPTETRLNLGDFNWTVEFWFLPANTSNEEGTVFEIGAGPRGENETTSLNLTGDQKEFVLINQSSGNNISLTTSLKKDEWQHLAFVYDADNKKLSHYVDGELHSRSEAIHLNKLPVSNEDYMSIGRNALWEKPLQGKIDELRFSSGMVYSDEFTPPESFSKYHNDYRPAVLTKGPPLLFESDTLDDVDIKNKEPLQLGGRKHVFIDDAFLEMVGDVEFTVNPPKKDKLVLSNIEGPFRKHLTVVEDEDGLIRMYNSVEDDYLQVLTSEDGVNFEAPKTGIEHEGKQNIVIPEHTGGKGNPFIDPNGKYEDKWKYVSGFHNRGLYLYTSPNGYDWTRQKTAIMPFQIGTQSATFYDDQRQMYVSYHRSGLFHTPGGATQRSSVLAETKDLYQTVHFNSLTQEEYWELDKKYRLRDPLPWWLDNGPLSPADFGMELPHAFDPTDSDPVGTDIYITKAQKYEHAPDTYLAFPIVYFHYEEDGPVTRQALIDSTRLRGAGPLETQLSVSRDGRNWKRYNQPAYVAPGVHADIDIKTAYLAHGMVKRGNELWQYYFGEPHYHSAWVQYDDKRSVFRLKQRLDGFVSIDSPYDKETYIRTKPFVFEGNRLKLNINTGAVGYTQVGFLDESGDPIEGFSVDDCVYINGDFIDTEVEWIQNRQDFKGMSIGEGESTEVFKNLKSTKDVSSLQGKTVQLVFRMRGSKLYSMEFTNK